MSLPSQAAQLLERHTVGLPEALAFLGIGHSLGYRMAKRYVARTGKLAVGPAFDTRQLRPKRDPKTGAWMELPCVLIGGKYVVRTDLLVAMVFPEVGWPV